jgi:phospholipid/cholesterol/gamma-HCH transport system substrate-binding protein
MFTDTKYNPVEILLGLIVITGILLLAYLAIGWINRSLLGTTGYVVYADFLSASGLHSGDPVRIAGVEVGSVESIRLANDQARIALRINENVTIAADATALLERDWFIGDTAISIRPGESEKTLGPGDEITRTKSPPSIQQLVGQLFAGDLIATE